MVLCLEHGSTNILKMLQPEDDNFFGLKHSKCLPIVNLCPMLEYDVTFTKLFSDWGYVLVYLPVQPPVSNAIFM